MNTARWGIVERLLKQVEGTMGRLVMAIAPNKPLDVVLYEAPVLVSSQAPHNPLRGFVQEAVSLLEQPTAAEIADFLHLPTAVVELVLGNLQHLGGVTSDTAGRWSVPEGAPRFQIGKQEPMVCRRTRKLLCYWVQREVLLPVLPRMRLRDMVALGVHKLQGEVADWYSQIASWDDVEGSKRGRPRTVRVLPLRSRCVLSGNAASASDTLEDASVTEDEVLVSRCRLDVVALTWASFRSGIWEIASRLWSRPTSGKDGEDMPFAPGEPFLGLSLLEQLLGDSSSLDELGYLFSPHPEAWRKILKNRDESRELRRDLDGNAPALIVGNQEQGDQHRRWRGLFTSFAEEARLLCFLAPPAVGQSDPQ